MKIRNVFSIVALTSSLLFTSCDKEDTTVGFFDNIKLDKTFLSVPTDGGSVTVKITATEEWSLLSPDTDYWKHSNTWIIPSDTVGVAGEHTLTFTSEAGDGRELSLKLICGGNTQNLVIRQGELEAVQVKVEDIIAGKVPQGKTVIVSGVCKNIYNTTYGNWYLDDGTGELTIYGTLHDGKEKEFSSIGIEEGDVVTVSGPYTLYGSTHELVNVTVLKISKSLVKIETESLTVPKEADKFTVKVSYKGENLQPSVPEEYENWVSITGVDVHVGVPTKIEQNPADTAYVSIRVADNMGGDRKGAVEFVSFSSDGKSSSKVTYSFFQKGAIIETTVDKLLAAEDGATQYRVTGYISKMANTTYGNYYIKDATGEIYVYGTLNNGESKKFEALGINEGDIVTIVGPKASYKGNAQLSNVTVEAHKAVKDITAAEFVAKDDDKTTYYRLTGTVSGIKDTDVYGNFDLTDESGKVYVYGLLQGWGGASKQFQSLGIKNGDTVTLVGCVGSYKGNKQVVSAFYVSHTSADAQ